MISRLAEFVARKLQHDGIIEMDDKEIYAYAFFMIFSYAFFLLLSIFMGVVLKIFFESILFFIVLCTVRGFAGGIHAKSEKMCTFLTIATIIISEVLIKILTIYDAVAIAVAVMALSTICIFIFSPLVNKQKNFNYREKIALKKKVIFSALLAIFLAILSFVLDKHSFGFSVAVGVTMSSFLLVLGKIEQVSEKDVHQ
jgi:accessory gene regulator B